MTTQLEDATRSKPGFQLLLSTIAALALAAWAMWFLSYLSVIWNPGQYGDFGFVVSEFSQGANDNSRLVTSINPRSPAEKAQIKIGDRVEALAPVRDQLLLSGTIAPKPHEDLTLRIFGPEKSRTVILRALPAAALPATEKVVLALQIIADFVFIAVGFIFVLLRPTRMTWAFYLAAFAICVGTLGWQPFSYISTPWLMVLGIAANVIVATGVVGFVVFCLRFPTNAPTGWRRGLDNLAPYAALALATLYVCEDFGGTQFIHSAPVTHLLWNIWLAVLIAALIGGPVVLLTTYFESRDPERQTMKWVIFGFTCTSAAFLVVVLGWAGLLARVPAWVVSIAPLLVITFPLSLAYAVIRHRIIEVRGSQAW